MVVLVWLCFPVDKTRQITVQYGIAGFTRRGSHTPPLVLREMDEREGECSGLIRIDDYDEQASMQSDS